MEESLQAFGPPVLICNKIRELLQAEGGCGGQREDRQHVKGHIGDIQDGRRGIVDKVVAEEVDKEAVDEVELEGHAAIEIQDPARAAALRICGHPGCVSRICPGPGGKGVQEQGKRAACDGLKQDLDQIQNCVVMHPGGLIDPVCVLREKEGQQAENDGDQDGFANGPDRVCGGGVCIRAGVPAGLMVGDKDTEEEGRRGVVPPVSRDEKIADQGVGENPGGHEPEGKPVFFPVDQEEAHIEGNNSVDEPGIRVQGKAQDAAARPGNEPDDLREHEDHEDPVEAADQEALEIVFPAPHAFDQAVARTEEEKGYKQVADGHKELKSVSSVERGNPRRADSLAEVMKHDEDRQQAKDPFGFLPTHNLLLSVRYFRQRVLSIPTRN